MALPTLQVGLVDAGGQLSHSGDDLGRDSPLAGKAVV
jgi:hypothetical protein